MPAEPEPAKPSRSPELQPSGSRLRRVINRAARAAKTSTSTTTTIRPVFELEPGDADPVPVDVAGGAAVGADEGDEGDEDEVGDEGDEDEVASVEVEVAGDVDTSGVNALS